MRSFVLAGALIAAISHALPQDGGCVTVTTEVIVPTSTATYTTTDVTTIRATTAEDLGTFTWVTRVSSTKTLETITKTIAACNATITNPGSTVYTTSLSTLDNAASTTPAAPPGYYKRVLGLVPRQDACTTTSTFTTTYGATYTFVAAPNATSTYTAYTDFSQATVTSTQYGGTAYAIASATTTAEALWCPSANATATAIPTTTLDDRCAPSALTSAYNGFGLEYASDVPAGGASYSTTTTDASSCCQLCANSTNCAASLWDSRSGACKLEFPVDYSTGELNCGEGALVYYDAGPNSPMAPGSGLWVAELCGNVQYGNAKPDDGT
ncbi:hypothetical protein LTR53_004478 [Teratosphaeriaceae sp. CCFEE 6253]|nr:hypothetical protein LTR53_004478 [Teratosphaeriaceae sp. CCFEE 6253]